MEETDDQNSEYMHLPKWSTGALLGVAGKRLKEIQEQSGVRIDVDKSDARFCKVRIEGDADQRQYAKELVEAAALAPRDASEPLPTPAAYAHSEQVWVPLHAAGAVIGKGGTVLNQIQSETGTRVSITQGSEEAIVSGPSLEALRQAKQWIESIVYGAGQAPYKPAAQSQAYLKPKQGTGVVVQPPNRQGAQAAGEAVDELLTNWALEETPAPAPAPTPTTKKGGKGGPQVVGPRVIKAPPKPSVAAQPSHYRPGQEADEAAAAQQGWYGDGDEWGTEDLGVS